MELISALVALVKEIGPWGTTVALVCYLAYALHKQWLVLGAHYKTELDERHLMQEKCEKMMELATRGTLLAEQMLREKVQK